MDCMEVTEANPFLLSLDEIIALNKTKDKPLLESTEITSSPEPTINGLTKQISSSADVHSVDQRLRSLPGFGSKQIHSRLGYNHHKRRRHPLQNLTAECARQSLQKAKFNAFRRDHEVDPMNPRVTVKNQVALKRLNHPARSVFPKFNRRNNGGLMGNSFGSSRSMIPPKFRHSVSKHLNPKIQEEIRSIIAKTPHSDPEALEGYEVAVQATDLSLNDRFTLYS